MNNPEEHQVILFPRNFIERGTIFGGTFKIRNFLEALVLALGIGIPICSFVPAGLSAKIILLCMTALPASMLALIGVAGESLTAFFINALRFLCNRRILFRSDMLPPDKNHKWRPRNKEHKARGKKHQPKEPQKEKTAQGIDPDRLPEKQIKKKERRQFDTSTKQGIRLQAKEDIRFLKYEKKWEKAQAKKEKQKYRQAQKKARCKEKEALKTARLKNPPSQNTPPVSKPCKKKRRMVLEDYLPIEKISNGIVYTTDHRYIKILEVEPINFLLRSAREQQGIIYSFISYLKISPVKLQIKMISKKADINKHLEQSALELSRETDPHCRILQEDYIRFVKKLSSKEAVSRRFFLIFEYEPFNANRKVEEKEILTALETAAQTAKTFLYQCGNEVNTHDNEDEFTTEVLYTLLNRTICAEKPLPKRIMKSSASMQHRTG